MGKSAGVIVLISLLFAGASRAAEDLEFEVASVRGPASPMVGIMRGGPGTSDPGRISYSHVTMGSILVTAFAVRDFQRIVGPDWIFEPNADTVPAYDIEAKLPANATKEQANEMMRNLLKSRFHLVFHMEKRTFEGYEMVVAKGGAKLTPAAPPQGPAPERPELVVGGMGAPRDKDGFPVLPPGYPRHMGLGSNGHMRVTVRAMPLSSLQDVLALPLYMLHASGIVDKTGLTGTYDFKLDYATSAVGEDPSDWAVEVFATVERQLGLSLKKAKVPIDVVVIDHIDKAPTEN
jgi:uncharacterized protein (TIGR03435 family)